MCLYLQALVVGESALRISRKHLKFRTWLFHRFTPTRPDYRGCAIHKAVSESIDTHSGQYCSLIILPDQLLRNGP
jgi:hypothetical protein